MGLFYTISPKFSCHAFVNEPLSNLKEQGGDMREKDTAKISLDAAVVLFCV